jgi:ribosomal protein S18 acetylase RimI-like enzyme
MSPIESPLVSEATPEEKRESRGQGAGYLDRMNRFNGMKQGVGATLVVAQGTHKGQGTHEGCPYDPVDPVDPVHEPASAERRLTVPLPVTVRTCRREDLRDLEWFGLFTEHQEIMLSTFESQERGETVMLVADVNGFPVGQVWINLTLKQAQMTGALWAVRVFPFLRNLGIGTRLIAAAEQALRRRGYTGVELGVEKDNPDARRFYERLGYCVTGTAQGEYSYTTPDGMSMQMPIDEWILRKELAPVVDDEKR